MSLLESTGTSNALATSRKSGVPVIDDCHMPEPQPSSSCERRRSESIETSQPMLKRQRLSHPSGSQPPPAFWDNLSKVWLTKRALRELDRRNTQAVSNLPHPLYRQAHRPIARKSLVESKRNRQFTQYNPDYLRSHGPKILKDIKLFARHGGPDLSDLRDVRVVR